MKLRSILIGSVLTSFLSIYAQESETSKHHTREVQYCSTHKVLEEKLKDPSYKALYEKEQKQLEHEEQLHVKSGAAEKATIYKIPIVFHVLHNGGVENISDAQILDQLAILNRDFRLRNEDTNAIISQFKGLKADVEIEFVLATKDPSGKCFSGITRTKNVLTDVGSNNGTNQAEAIKYGNDVYQGNWPSNKYLNIFICKNIGGAAGYTYQPSNWSGNDMSEDAIWILNDYIGTFGTGSAYSSRALTHEIGHWLNLQHTWGNTNDPGVSCGDDKVTDTPLTKGHTTCSLYDATCTNGVVENVQNYMEYAYCSNMFTVGQKTRMRAALTSSVGGRNNLWTVGNLSATGADGNLTICKTDFEVSKTIVCVGDTIQFTDKTYNKAISWNWSFPGAVTTTSTQQNPSIKYLTPGTYNVSLTASDGSSSDSEIKTSFITVLPHAVSLPFYEGFESLTTLSNSSWNVSNLDNNNTFELKTGTGSTGTKFVGITNYGQSAGTTDILEGNAVDLSSLTNTDVVTLTFRYAYRKKTSTDNEYLRIYATKDCGEVWDLKKTINGAGLSSKVEATSWTPTASSDWTTVHVTNLFSSYFVSNFRYRFQFEGNGGNNIYLDDINLYKGSPTTSLVTAGIENVSAINGGVEVYPNPADDELNLKFSVEQNETLQINIIDVTGKLIQSNEIHAVAGSNLVLLNTNGIQKGMYLIQVGNGTSFYTSHVTIQ